MTRLQRRPAPRRTDARTSGRMPLLVPGGDPQVVRVHALLAPLRDVTLWRRALRLGTPARRAAAAVCLGTRPPKDAVLLLAWVLNTDADAWVRQCAVMALQHNGSTAVVPVLCAHAAREQDPAVRAALMRALGWTEKHHAGVEAVLLHAVQTGSTTERADALWSLHLVDSNNAVPASAEHLSHPSAKVRRVAAAVLAARAPGHAALDAAARDPDHAVVVLARAQH